MILKTSDYVGHEKAIEDVGFFTASVSHEQKQIQTTQGTNTVDSVNLILKKQDPIQIGDMFALYGATPEFIIRSVTDYETHKEAHAEPFE